MSGGPGPSQDAGPLKVPGWLLEVGDRMNDLGFFNGPGLPRPKGGPQRKMAHLFVCNAKYYPWFSVVIDRSL